MATYPELNPTLDALLRQGLAIPAHPLALTPERKLDERHQRALSRYYLAAGAGGLAVGVHTTQFEIRDPKIGLHRPVLELAKSALDAFETQHNKTILRVAGICGATKQAVAEAEMARGLGYQIGLLSLGALKEASTEALIEHAKAVAGVMPIMGFYLQPSVGGRLLGLDFWRPFCEIPNVCSIKLAPFNRYQTLDALRGVAESGRADEIALYTGNDDTIIADLLTPFSIEANGRQTKLHFAGGLLGHWAVWTKRAVEQLEQIKAIRLGQKPIPPDMLTLAAQVSESNAAFFDPSHAFAGCIAGLHEILRRQGLMRGRWSLSPSEDLSPGQMEEIDRVHRAYPHLNDDEFVQEHLDDWLA